MGGLDLSFDEPDSKIYGEEILVEDDNPLSVLAPAKKSMVLFFLIDVSSSMKGDKIAAVNRAMAEVLPELIEAGDSTTAIKVAVLEFSSGWEWKTMEPVPVEKYQKWNALQAEGVTDLGGALIELNRRMSRKQFLQTTSLSYAPIIFLITDGYPTDNYQKGLHLIKENKWFKFGIKIALAVGNAVDRNVLIEFTGDPEFVLEAEDAKSLGFLIQAVSVTSSQIGSKSMSIIENGDRKIEFSEKDVENSKKNEVKKAIKEIKQDIMMDSEGTMLSFEEGW